jgi:hypothetical protein
MQLDDIIGTFFYREPAEPTEPARVAVGAS